MVELKQLEDTEFVQEFDLENKYYLEVLFKKIKNFLIHIPVPYVLDFDKERNILFLRIGNNKKSFQLNHNIYYKDFITMMKDWAVQFYPQYVLEDEYGIILKIFFKTNEFLFFRNGVKELRYAGMRNVLVSLSDLLKTVRTFTENKDIKDFIIHNSTLIEVIENNDQRISIAYDEQMMKNFFMINFNELRNYQVERKDVRTYMIGKYDICFVSDLSEKECLDYLAERK